MIGLCGNVNAQTIIVQDAAANNPRAYTDLKIAIDEAQSGDYVYLSGGVYDLTQYRWKGYDNTGNYNYLVVSKPLHFVGAGYNQGADAPYLKGTLALRKAASGSSFNGVQMDYLMLDSVSNAQVNRCKIGDVLYLCGYGSNLIVTECVTNRIYTQSNIAAGSHTEVNYAAIFSKNIIYDFQLINNATITNNIFIGTGSPCFSTKNSTIKNNIFASNISFYALTNSNITNNVFVGSPFVDGSNVFTNNVTNNLIDDIFVNYSKGDYHLKAGSPAIGLATDGRDAGIYGTTFPFKDTRIPANPYFKIKNVAPETDADGKLKIDVIIEAQER